MTRIWKDVPGHESRYEVSNDGLVRTKPRILKPYPSKNGGHLQITLTGRTRTYVHRIVASAFIQNPDGKPVVNHKNGDPSDNRLENLEWVTSGENVAHGYRENGRVHYSNVRVGAVNSNGAIELQFNSMAEAAKSFGVSRGAIRSALLRRGLCCGYEWVKL